MDEAKIVINTTMTKEDYRKFLYIATFKRNEFIIPMLGLFVLAGGLIISFHEWGLNLVKLIISWVFLFGLAIGTILFKVERRNARRVKTDKTGAFDSVNTLKFFDDRMVMENEALKSTGELRYDQFFTLLESRDYFILYLTANQASLIRKKDIEGLDDFEKFITQKFKGRYKKI